MSSESPDERPARVALDPLPENAILVHLGPHKTGTTAIQTALADLRPILHEHGVLYPGTKMAQHREAKSLLQYRQGWLDDGEPPPAPEVWSRFAARVAAFPGRVVISSEFLSEADANARRELVHDLGPERVYLIAGARNPAGMALSNWQQVVRTYGSSTTLKEWLEKSFRRDPTQSLPPSLGDSLHDQSTSAPASVGANRFWQRADSAALVSRWLEVVPADRFTVIALDERDRGLLPATFEQLLGLPEGLLAKNESVRANRGLTAVEVAFIRQINVRLKRRLSWADYSRTMRSGVLQRLLEVREPGPDEARNLLPAWAVKQALAEAERSITGLGECGVRIVGDLASLRIVPGKVGQTPRVRAVPLDLAAEAVVGAIAVATRNSWSLDAPPIELAPPQPTSAPDPTDRATSPQVDTLTARQLARILAARVRAGLRRRLTPARAR